MKMLAALSISAAIASLTTSTEARHSRGSITAKAAAILTAGLLVFSQHRGPSVNEIKACRHDNSSSNLQTLANISLMLNHR